MGQDIEEPTEEPIEEAAAETEEKPETNEDAEKPEEPPVEEPPVEEAVDNAQEDEEGEELKEEEDVDIIVDTEPVVVKEEKIKKADKKGKKAGGGKKGKKKKGAEEGENQAESDIPQKTEDDVYGEEEDEEEEQTHQTDEEEEQQDQTDKSEPVEKEPSLEKVDKKGKKGKKEKKGKKGAKVKPEPEPGDEEIGETKVPTESMADLEAVGEESKPDLGKKKTKKGKSKSKVNLDDEEPDDLKEAAGDESKANLEKKKSKKGKSKSKVNLDDEEPDDLKDDAKTKKKSRSRIKTQESKGDFNKDSDEELKRPRSRKKIKKGESTDELKKSKKKSKSATGITDSKFHFTLSSSKMDFGGFDDESESSDEDTKKKKTDKEASGGKKTKKGKKSKKGKKPKGEVIEEAEETQDQKDFKEAMAQVTEEVKEKKGKKGKKGKGKKGKKSKTGKGKKLTPEQLEKLQKEQEEAAKKQAEEERRILIEEAKKAEEEDKRHLYEYGLRTEQLTYDFNIRLEIEEYTKKLEDEENIKKEWETYLECRTLPDGTKCPELTTYLHTWNDEIQLTSMETASKRTTDLLELLEELEDGLILVKNDEGNTYNNLIWVRQLLRDCQNKSLNEATFALLRFVETKMNRINMNLADFDFQDDNIILSLWLRKQLPIPLPNPRRPPRPRIDINFESLNLTVLCPLSLDGEGLAIRALYHRYDHYSDLSASFKMPEVDEIFNIGSLDYSNMEWRAKLMYKFENRVRKPPKPKLDTDETTDIKTDAEEQNLDELEIGPDDPIPIVPYRKLDPSPSEFIVQKEETLYQTTRENMHIEMEENAINLRQFTILGGVYKIDLLQQPPQPQDFILINMYITTLLLPKQLEYIPFFVEYTPPAPPEEGAIRTPEEIEEELKKNEEEMDQLILVTLKWPDHVLFLDLPFVCFWEEEKKQWTRKNVFDLKHVEDAGTLSFRTQNFGTFALGTLRYSHLPIQTWELRPEEDGTATLQITSAILIFEFNIKDKLISLQLQNCPNNALKDQLGKYYDLHLLIRGC